MHSTSFKDYASSPTQCAELAYLELQPQPGELRFTQETRAPPSLTIDAPQPSPLLNLFHSTNLQHAAAPYSSDESGALYPSHGSIYGSDSRPRLTSKRRSSTPSTGMAHAPTHGQRSGGHMGALDQYSTATPPYRRGSEQLPRSPAFVASSLRRHQLSTSQGSLGGFASPSRMDGGSYAQQRPGQGSVPPLQPVQTLGSLNYIDSAMTPIKVDISGTVDKGPFLSCEQEWTCYRRNYLACVCSYALSPLYYPNVPVQFTPPAAAAQPLQVYGFAMCISAVVADNEQQHIDLVQHTPKRDKGPISKPSKIPMAPKTGAAAAHQALHGYGDGPALAGGRGLYADGGFGAVAAGVAQQLPAEHTFERIQFKNATLNNGKRRAAQQYYHLIVELWADVGAQGPDPFVKVAYRKSAKMIVRGRSPGHYQNERRGSQGNGPGGSAGALSGFAPLGPMAAAAAAASYATANDGRGAVYGPARHHDIPEEAAIMAPDDAKALDSSKAYHYYSAPMYDGHHERVDLFAQRSGPDAGIPSMASDAKVKHEYDFGMLPRPFNPTTSASRVADHRQHDPFDGKATSGGYYPSIMSSSTGIHMTMA